MNTVALPIQMPVGLDWPGRDEGLSQREGEVLALITQGRTNAEIAGLVYLSANSIKSYIRSAYRKIGVNTRVEAVLWGVDHNLRPGHHSNRVGDAGISPAGVADDGMPRWDDLAGRTFNPERFPGESPTG